MVADGGLGRDLQRMEERQRTDARPHLDVLGQRGGLADQQVRARKLVRRLMIEERAVLADPGLGHAEPVGDDDLVQILVVGGLGDLVVAGTVGEKADFHDETSVRAYRRRISGLVKEPHAPAMPAPLPSRPMPVHIPRMAIQDERLQATARHLEREALDGLIAVNFGHNSFLELHAVFVLCGVRPIGESAVVVDRGGRSTLIVTPAWDGERAAAASRTSKTVGTDDLAAALAAAVAEHRIDPQKTVTVGLATLGQALARRIEGVLGGKARASDGFIRELARIRSAEELAASRKATAIAEQGYQHMLDSFARACANSSWWRNSIVSMKQLGAEDNFLLLSASQHNLAVRAAGGRVLDHGDIILSEITPCWQGQFAQLCRTTVIGEPGRAW